MTKLYDCKGPALKTKTYPRPHTLPHTPPRVPVSSGKVSVGFGRRESMRRNGFWAYGQNSSARTVAVGTDLLPAPL